MCEPAPTRHSPDGFQPRWSSFHRWLVVSLVASWLPLVVLSSGCSDESRLIEAQILAAEYLDQQQGKPQPPENGAIITRYSGDIVVVEFVPEGPLGWFRRGTTIEVAVDPEQDKVLGAVWNDH